MDGRDDQGGQAPFGNYIFKVLSKDAQGNEIQLPTALVGKVTGIQYAGGNPILYLGAQAVNPSDIIAIFEAKDAENEW